MFLQKYGLNIYSPYNDLVVSYLFYFCSWFFCNYEWY